MINITEHYVILAILLTGFSFGGRFRYRMPKASLAVNIGLALGISLSGEKNLIYAGIISVCMGIALAEAVKKDYERMAKINAANSNLSRNERMQRVRDKLQK